MSQAVATRSTTSEVSTVGISKALAGKALNREQVIDLTTQIRESKTSVDRVVGDVMFDAALMFHNVTEVSQVVGKQDGAVYAGQGDYAKALGFSESYGSRLVRLGRAVMRHDVRKGSAQWAFLCTNASSAVFAPVLGKEAVSTEEFRKVLDKAMKDVKVTGKIEAAPREAQPDEGEGRGEDKGTEAPKAPATAGDLIALLPAIDTVLKDLSDEGASKVHAAILRMVSNDKARRKVLAAKAAEEAAAKDAAAESTEDAAPTA